MRAEQRDARDVMLHCVHFRTQINIGSPVVTLCTARVARRARGRVAYPTWPNRSDPGLLDKCCDAGRTLRQPHTMAPKIGVTPRTAPPHQAGGMASAVRSGAGGLH